MADDNSKASNDATDVDGSQDQEPPPTQTAYNNEDGGGSGIVKKLRAAATGAKTIINNNNNNNNSDAEGDMENSRMATVTVTKNLTNDRDGLEKFEAIGKLPTQQTIKAMDDTDLQNQKRMVHNDKDDNNMMNLQNQKQMVVNLHTNHSNESETTYDSQQLRSSGISVAAGEVTTLRRGQHASWRQRQQQQPGAIWVDGVNAHNRNRRSNGQNGQRRQSNAAHVAQFILLCILNVLIYVRCIAF